MARNETTATSTVLLNGEQAKAQLEILEAKAKSLRKSMKEAQEVGDLTGLKKYNKELSNTQKEMRQVRSEAFNAKKVLDDLSGSSLKDLYAAQKKIDSLLKNGSVKRNSAEWKELQLQLRAVKSEIYAVNAESKVTQSTFSKIANFTNKTWQLFAAGAAALMGVVLGLKSAAMEAAKMSDIYAQVRKYTGESAEGVAELNSELKKMDTRTAREELNRLLGEAGKIGVKGKEDLLQFAKAADIIQVALGADLGEDAVKSIGKLTKIFGVEGKMGLEKSMLAVGSAINEVAQNSTASEPYLLEFTNRLSGMGNAAGMTIPQLIGFASVLDQNAQQVEMSATALNKFIATLATKSEDVANAIGIPAARLKKLVGTDMNAALMLVFKELNKKGGLVDLAPLFKDLGAEGARAASVITILANKYKDLSTEQALSNKAFNQGISVVKEFDIQNNTMQARLDKSKKAFLDASETLGNSLSPAFLHSTNAAVYMIKALAGLPEWLKVNKGLLLTLATTMTIYAVAVNRARIASLAQIVVEKTKILWQRASTAATLLQVAVTGYLTGATRVANLATKQLFVTLAMNPYIALGVAIAAVTIGMYKLVTANRENNKILQSNIAIQNKVDSQYDEQNSKIKSLVFVLQSELFSLYERKRALLELKGIIPAYHGDLDKEGKLINDNREAIDQYLVSLEKEIRMQASKDELIALNKEKFAKEKEIRLAEEKAAEIKKNTSGNQGMIMSGGIMLATQGLAVNKLKKELEHLNAVIKNVGKDYANLSQVVTAPGHTGPKEGDISADGKQIFKNGRWVNIKPSGPDNPDDKHKKALEEADKWLDKEQIELKRQHANNILSEEEYARKMIDLNEKFLEKKRDIYKKTDKEYLNYQNQLEDIKLKRQDDAEKLNLENLITLRNTRLNAIVIYNNAQREQLELDLQDEIITQNEYDNKILALDKVLAESRLYVAQENAKDVAAFQYKSDKERVAAVEAVNREIEAANKDLSDAEKKILRKSIADKKAIEKEINEIEKKYGINTYKEKRKEYEQDLIDLKESYKKKLKLFENDAKEKAKITKQYESTVAKIKFSQAKKVAEDIAEITQAAASLTSAVQEAQMLAVDNKYAAELKAAKGNADETTRIEEEIASEKIKVQKKYADTNFAISVAQISANTAVAIMKALADLGPIAGPIAAGLIGLTGLAQIAVANEQREAVKQLYTGGYTEPGDKYKPAGIVHAGEFVGNQDAVRSTPVRKVFDLIDHAQKTNTVGRISNEDIARVVGIRKGYADGGYTPSLQTNAAMGSTGVSKEELAWAINMAMKENNAATAALVSELRKGVKAVYSISGNDGVVNGIDKYNQLIKNAGK